MMLTHKFTRKYMKHIVLIIIAATLLSACQSRTFSPEGDARIRLNQCGYRPSGTRTAFVMCPARHFELVTLDGRTLQSGEVEPPVYWDDAADTVRLIHFDTSLPEGEYRIIVDDSIPSHPFSISPKAYGRLVRDVVRAYYYNRCSTAIDSIHGHGWARPAGHPDTCVLIHSSAASKKRPAGTKVSSPGGWYDAGDYGKYIVNSSITTYTLLLAATLYPQIVDTLRLNIPETGSTVPDLVSESLYNLRWMLTMQDPDDGGVYHKMTTLNFEGFIMPDACRMQRYMSAKSTAASLDFAATMSFAARHLAAIDPSLAPLADSCRNAAVSAYAYAMSHPDKPFRNDAEISTGEYGDEHLSDEHYWAAVEMYLLDGSEEHYATLRCYAADYGVPEWAVVGTLAHYSVLLDDNERLRDDALSALQTIARRLLSNAKASPAGLTTNGFEWGSNSYVANDAALLLITNRFDPQPEYRAAALADIDYLLGCNATGFCYVTGAGQRSPQHPHHRPSSADAVSAPVPGFLVGGPNVIVPTDCGEPHRPAAVAKAYEDSECSYSTNEVAINWNAPLCLALLGVMAD